jgi:hypothetical protein
MSNFETDFFATGSMLGTVSILFGQTEVRASWPTDERTMRKRKTKIHFITAETIAQFGVY